MQQTEKAIAAEFVKRITSAWTKAHYKDELRLAYENFMKKRKEAKANGVDVEKAILEFDIKEIIE